MIGKPTARCRFLFGTTVGEAWLLSGSPYLRNWMPLTPLIVTCFSLPSPGLPMSQSSFLFDFILLLSGDSSRVNIFQTRSQMAYVPRSARTFKGIFKKRSRDITPCWFWVWTLRWQLEGQVEYSGLIVWPDRWSHLIQYKSTHTGSLFTSQL